MPLSKDSKFVFCLPDDASLSEPFHIRVLDKDGPKFDGGVNEPPLCGYHGQWFSGRDIDADLTEKALGKACAICFVLYSEMEGNSWALKILSEM
jgi:hypothetical protein